MPVEQKAYLRFPTYVKFNCGKWGIFSLVDSLEQSHIEEFFPNAKFQSQKKLEDQTNKHIFS